MSGEAVEKILADQGGKCGICQGGMSKSQTYWHLDHDHETGHSRAMLCRQCNLTLGNSGENIHRLQRCMAYIRFHKKIVRWPSSERWCGVPQGGYKGNHLPKNQMQVAR